MVPILLPSVPLEKKSSELRRVHMAKSGLGLPCARTSAEGNVMRGKDFPFIAGSDAQSAGQHT